MDNADALNADPGGIPPLDSSESDGKPPTRCVIFGADHAGRSLMAKLAARAEAAGFDVRVQGVDGADAKVDYPDAKVDYPDCVDKVVRYLLTLPCPSGREPFAVLVCGTGMGMCMGANRFSTIRAAVCRTTADAVLTRGHNDANVLCLGARGEAGGDGAVQGHLATAETIFDAFAITPYEGGRHDRRLRKLFRLNRGWEILKRPRR
uniref:Ribose/galactose isomerase n=1 Tax=Marseillevirus LCMAC103 TaxID=2506604 RepID=A0A481YVP4_9VIRU|nr:MAG: ribose/galactose isomerase [Marseillevirus LCMAC103]